VRRATAAFHARISERGRSLLHVTERRAYGAVHLPCLALGPSATVTCPDRLASLAAPNAVTRVQISSKPANIGHILTFIAEHSDPERTTHLANRRLERQQRAPDRLDSGQSPPTEIATVVM
jgi:hypothetical protein